MYNKQAKLETILKQLNADPSMLVQRNIGVLGGAPGSEAAKEQESLQKGVIYGPRVKLQHELSMHTSSYIKSRTN
jgi:hypothetical protein